ncbi:MAG: sigma-70 family RNA polymerase sigma factor [Candidatus Hydrogenedentes bacterium]|nr:sigma-70 family RNA polymerase sigma factor [Candidatus Hydrogenedentota bacterium]
MSDSEIIRRVLSGEDALFSRIVNRYSGYVWAICSSYIRNPADREDVAQETFVECYRKLNTLRQPAAFGRWLSQLARRRCLMWLRAAGRREASLARYEEQIETTADIETHSGSGELRQGIRDAIEGLPDDYREALLLRYAEGYSTEEAASFLGISYAAMRKRIERAHHMLKDRIWNEIEPALAEEKHEDRYVRGILSAIPFGSATWLGTTAPAVTTTAAAATVSSKLALIGGIAVMSKKAMLIGGAIVILLGFGYVAIQKAGVSNTESQGAAVPQKSEKELASTMTETAADVGAQPAIADAATPPDQSKKSTAIPRKPAPPSSVSGHVKDRVGKPIAGADVHVEVGSDRYTNDVIKTFHAKSKEDGSYEVAGIDVFGRANIFGTATGFVMERQHEKIVPGAKLTGIDFSLLEAAYYVAGRVVNESQMPVPGASVDSLYFGYDESGLAHTAKTGQTTGNISGSKFVFAVTDDSGHFALAIPSEGLCDLRVTKEGYGPGFFPSISTGTTNAELVLRAGGAISGVVSDESGKAVAGVNVRVLGEALPGGLETGEVRIQKLPVPTVTVTTDDAGKYLADKLGEDYVYTVSVPAEEKSLGSDDSQDPIRVHIAEAMRELDEGSFGGASARAMKTGIHVKAGVTTTDVNLTIGGPSDAEICGKVTDRTSGKPACPVVVTAALVGGAKEQAKTKYWFQAEAGASAVTHLDGTYELSINNVEQGQRFRISYAFMTEGGSAWEQPDEEVAVFDLNPGDKKQLDFSVDAPMTVPVRYVDTKGGPLEGISAAMRRAGGKGGCGGTLMSDAEGRVTFHGIPGNVSLQAVAWKDTGNDLMTLGVSEPFTGQPGETVPEVVVVCRMPGSIQVMLTFPDGRAVANANVTCEASLADGSAPPIQGMVTTDASGAIQIFDMVPEGTYRGASVSLIDPSTSQPYSASSGGFEVATGAMTDLGTLTVQPEKDLSRVVESADWGRKGNEAIAAVYSKEGLAALSNSGMILKTGFALYDVGKYQDALDVFAQMSAAADNDTMSAVSYIWQGQMLDLLGKRQDAIAAYTTAANMNVTGEMRHDQFGLAYSPSEYAKERLQTPFTRIENQMK